MDDTRGVCGVCRRQVSKYFCPRCNLPYCSLSCFRSEAHLQCSEAFYKKEVEDEIQAAPKTATERREMLAMLKRFEEENAQEQEGNDAEDLATRIADLDIDAAEPDVLWLALNEDEKQRFTSILRDAGGAVAQQLLAEDSKIVPWWTDYEHDASGPPDMLQVDPALIEKARGMKGPPLLYNIFGLSLAYAHTIRTFTLSALSTSSDGAALQLLIELTPFLVERKSTQVFQSVEEAVTFLWSRIAPTSIHMIQLMDDAQHLLLPVPVYEAESGPHHRTLRMLADLSTSFSSNLTKRKLSHVPPKLLFYGAQVLVQPLQAFSLLRLEIEAQRQACETRDAA